MHPDTFPPHSPVLILVTCSYRGVVELMSSPCSAPRTDSFFPLPFPLQNILFINDLWNHTEEMLPLEAGSPSPPWVRIVIWVMLLLAGVRWLWLWHFHSHLRSSVWTCKQMHGNRNCRKLQMSRLFVHLLSKVVNVSAMLPFTHTKKCVLGFHSKEYLLPQGSYLW